MAGLYVMPSASVVQRVSELHRLVSLTRGRRVRHRGRRMADGWQMDGRWKAGGRWQMLEPVVIKVYIYIYLYTNKARCVAGRLSGSHINRQRLEGRGRGGDGQMADGILSGLCGGGSASVRRRRRQARRRAAAGG